MGVRVDYQFSSFVNDANRALIMRPEARFLKAFVDAGPKFLVTAFVPDAPGVLSRVLTVLSVPLAALAKGADSTASPVSIETAFSIEGSVTSVVLNSYLLAFVVKPTVGDVEFEDPEQVAASLKGAILGSLSGFAWEEAGDPADRVKVFDFASINNEIFASSRFAEYRFSVSSRGGRGSARSLSQAIEAVAAAAGERNVPIAYVYFPDEPIENDRLVAKIALAAPEARSDATSLEWDAIRAALRQRLILSRYRPEAGVADMEGRFGEIVDFEDEATLLEQFPSPQRDLHSLASRVVFVTCPARYGLVAKMLSNGVSRELVGGTMTVLGGHTIACWVAAEEGGLLVARKILKNLEGEGARVIHRRVPAKLENDPAKRQRLWFAWHVPDQPSVFLNLDRLFRESVERRMGSAVGTDYRYSISRVISDGSCAGKANVDLTNAGSLVDSQLAKALEDDLRMSDWYQHNFGACQSSSEANLIVSLREPGEEPWASLVAGFAPVAY